MFRPGIYGILELGLRYRRKLGYMPQQQGMYEQMTAESFLSYIGQMKGLRGKKLQEEVNEVLKLTADESMADLPYIVEGKELGGDEFRFRAGAFYDAVTKKQEEKRVGRRQREKAPAFR